MAGGSCHSLAPSECQAFHVEVISSPGQPQEGLGSKVWWGGLEPRSLGLKNLEFFLKAVGSRVLWSALCSPDGMQGDCGPHGITSISRVLQIFLGDVLPGGMGPRKSVTGPVSLVFLPRDPLWENWWLVLLNDNF